MTKTIAGVDEVGKGCLFGPVFAGAVVLNKDASDYLYSSGLTDSKALSSKKRAALVPLIKSSSSSWALGQASAKEIDCVGIRKATERAMLRALQRLSIQLDLIIVDGILPLRLWEGPQKTIIKGDSKFPEISAASVLAKEYRDNLIKRLAQKHNGYGLATNVGYGTKAHRERILEAGPTTLHRRSFLNKILRSTDCFSQRKR